MTRRSENAGRPTSNEVQRLGSVDGSRLLLSEPDEVLAKDRPAEEVGRRSSAVVGVLAKDTNPRTRIGLLPARSPALTPRPGEPSLENSSRQRRVSDAALSREEAQCLQVLLVKAQSDLLRARWVNLDVEILQLLRELLDTMARPEVTLLSVASEHWDLSLPSSCCTH